MENAYERKELKKEKEPRQSASVVGTGQGARTKPGGDSWKPGAVLLAAGALIAIGIAVWSLGLFAEGGDSLSADESADIERAYNEAIASKVNFVQPLDVAALKAMHERGELVAMGSDEQATALIEDVERGAASASEITLWDFLREDGDVVMLKSSLFATEVAIFHEPVTVTVPHLPGEIIELRAVKDGRGGVTVGLMTPGGELRLPILSEGATLPIATL